MDARSANNQADTGNANDNPNNQDGPSHANHPYFYNQPHYNLQGNESARAGGEESNVYIKLIIKENEKLKSEIEILQEKLERTVKGVGLKKRKILNEIVALISTKNSFESRFVSEITHCPYKETVIEKTVTERVYNQSTNM